MQRKRDERPWLLKFALKRKMALSKYLVYCLYLALSPLKVSQIFLYWHNKQRKCKRTEPSEGNVCVSVCVGERERDVVTDLSQFNRLS